MGKTLLLIEDNEHILADNQWWLVKRGYEVLLSTTIEQAKDILRKIRPDGIILDIMLPDGNGLDFLQELRTYSDVPVLLLTGLSASQDVVRGLAAGGDDYLSKPYDYEVFLARVAALLRRSERIPEAFKIGSISLNLFSNQALIDDRDMMLTQKQFALLLLFARNMDKILSTEFLYESVWKQPMQDDVKAIKTSISRLRSKLDGSGFAIHPVRGEGYCFEAVSKP